MKAKRDDPVGRAVNKMVVFDSARGVRRLKASLLNPPALVGESEESDALALSRAVEAHIRAHGAKSAAMAFAWALNKAAPGERELIAQVTRAATF